MTAIEQFVKRNVVKFSAHEPKAKVINNVEVPSICTQFLLVQLDLRQSNEEGKKYLAFGAYSTRVVNWSSYTSELVIVLKVIGSS